MTLVESEHLLEREVTGDITVEYKEESLMVVVLENLLSQPDRPCCAHRSVFH